MPALLNNNKVQNYCKQFNDDGISYQQYFVVSNYAHKNRLVSNEGMHVKAITVTANLIHTHNTHNRFTALLEFVRDYPGEQVPER